MSNAPVLVLFLKALVAARKSVGLYPAGSEMANAWVERLHASLEGFLRQGLTFPLRVGPDRFGWSGEDVLTLDPGLEALRFDLESRGIAEFSLDPGIERWEVQVFLELLNRPAHSFTSIADAAAQLRDRQVRHITVRVPSASQLDGAAAASWQLLQTGKDALDLFVDAVLAAVDERFGELTYDRPALAGWLKSVADGESPDSLYAAVRMLGSMADSGGDREIRTRTMVEALLLLPEPALAALLSQRLIPQAGSDLVAFNLLTQMTEDELAEVARLVPPEQLLALGSELLEFPWEEGKRQRLVEAITGLVRSRGRPESETAPGRLLGPDDPLLIELRDEIVAGCRPEVLLERSTDVLLALIFNVESEEYPAFAVDALEEVVGEGLARGRLDLAVHLVRTLSGGATLSGQKGREHTQRVALFRRRLAGRTQVSLVGGLLRETVPAETTTLAAEYLRLVARDGIEEFTGLLAEEKDRRVRGRMCQVLVEVGAAVVPVLRPWLDDSRWYVARNVVYVLGRVGDIAAFSVIAGTIEHAHFRVRMEAIRALVLLGGASATGHVIRALGDADQAVRVAAIKALGSLRSDEAVPALREIAERRDRDPESVDLREEAVSALGAIATPYARTALEQLTGRRVWFWQRGERRIKSAAESALRVARAGGRSDEDDDES